MKNELKGFLKVSESFIDNNIRTIDAISFLSLPEISKGILIVYASWSGNSQYLIIY
jgi:hypothetical protein